MSSREEIVAGDRFGFGENWREFLVTLDDERIRAAEQSLRDMLGVADLQGKTVLDIGSGSGLFSLAARRLGASVTSFDYDIESVACTRTLRDRYFPGDTQWRIEEGNVLDTHYLASLGQFDVVYSWGVLHHTGAMWQALENVVPLVAPTGSLFIAIYNDQGGASERWRAIKRFYNRSPQWTRPLMVAVIALWWEVKAALSRLARRQNPFRPLGPRPQKQRGMSLRHDIVDWVGGYPFEVATPDAIFDFYTARGFSLGRLTTSRGGHGCNQFVFHRKKVSSAGA